MGERMIDVDRMKRRFAHASFSWHADQFTPSVSVAQRIRQAKQPQGGYIKPRDLEVISLGDGIGVLHPEESVDPRLIGVVVRCLVRVMTGTPVEDTFEMSLFGAALAGESTWAERLLGCVTGLDDISIVSAIRLSGFDAYTKHFTIMSVPPFGFQICAKPSFAKCEPAQDIKPGIVTIENVRAMVKRSLYFLYDNGSKGLDEFTFEGGYTDSVSSGGGDFMTADTLWDFRVSKKRPKKEHTLQLLMHWRMGLHSVHPEFQNIKYLGIYNPRLNKAFRIAVADIPQDVIGEVESKIIGY